jgi:TP901 family phage tail tape measure protein
MAREAQGQIRAMQAEIAALNKQLAAANAQASRTAAGGMASMLTAGTKFTNQLQYTGRQLMRNFTLPLALAGGAAMKWALDNETAMTRVKKVYGDGVHNAQFYAKELQSLGKAFEELSNHFGIAQSDAINIAADWAAAGSSGLALAKSVRLTMETMILGELSAVDATRALIAIQAQYGQSVEDLSKTIDILNMVENQTGTNMGDLIQGFARAAGVARSAGVDVNHLAAYMAALVPSAGGAAQAGNALKTIFSRLLAPTEDAVGVLAQLGIEVADTGWKSLTASQRIDILAQRFNALPKAQKAVVSATLASRYQINKFDVLMRDIVNPLGYYQKALAAAGDTTKNFRQRNQELQQVLNSQPQKLRQVGQIIKNSMADVIVPLIPYIVYLAQKVKDLFQAFSNMNPVLQKFILLGFLGLAVLGPLLTYMGSLGTALFITRNLMFLALRPFGLLIIQLAVLAAAPFKLIAAGFILMIQGMWAAVTGIFRIIPFLATVGPKIFAVLNIAGAIAIDAMVAVMAYGLTTMMGVFRAFLPLIMAMAGPIAAAFSTIWAALITLFGPAFAGLWAAFSTAMGAIMIGFQVLWVELTAAVVELWTAFTFAMEVILVSMGQTLMEIWKGFTAAFYIVTAAWGTGIKALWLAINEAFMVISFFAKPMILGVWANITFGIKFLMERLLEFMAVASRVFVLFFETMMAGARAVMIAGWAAMTMIMEAAVIAWEGILAFGAVALEAFMSLPAVLSGLWAAGWAVIEAVTAAAMVSMEVLMTVGTAILVSPWTYLVLAILGVVYYFKDQLAAAWTAVVGTVKSLFSGLMSGLSGIGSFFSSIADGIVSAFSMLPQSIQNVFLRVVSIVAAAAHAVYDLFSYLNPFAHHSPSLVENVTAGVDLISKKYASLRNVGVYFRQAAADLAAFGKATQGLANADQQREVSGQRANIAKVSPQALPQFDKLAADIPILQNQLAKLTPVILAQAAVTQKWKDKLTAADAALKGEQNKLDKLNDAASKAQDQLAGMSGELEVLRGTQTDLRNAGAGSDILGPLGDQIGKIQSAADAISGPNGPIAQAAAQQKVVDALQATRDAISARYDLEQQKLDELSNAYDAIEQQINDITSAMSKMSQAADTAMSAASGGGKLGPGAQNFINAAGGDFADPGGNGGIGRVGGIADQSALIDQYTKGLTAETAGMFGGIDMFGPIKDMWKQAWGWIQDHVMPYVQPVIDAVTGFWDGIDWSGVGKSGSGIFESIQGGAKDVGKFLQPAGDAVKGFFDGVASVAQRLWQIFGPDLTQIFNTLRDAFVQIWTDIAPKVVPALDAVWAALKLLWAIVKPIAAVIGILLVGALKLVTSILAKFLGPALKFIIGRIAALLEIFTGLVNIVVGLFTGDFSRVWLGMKQLVHGVVDFIWNYIKYGFGLAWATVKWVFEAIVGLAKWLYDNLVPGWIKAIIDGIWATFKFLWGIAVWIWDNVLSPIVTIFKNLLVILAIPTILLIDMIWAIFKGLWWLAKWIWDNVLKPVIGVFRNVIGGVISAVSTVVSGVRASWAGLKTMGQWIWDNVLKPVVDFFGRIWNAVKPGLNDFATNVSNLFGSIAGGIKTGINAGIDAINTLIGGLNWIGSHVPGIKFHIDTITKIGGSSSVASNASARTQKLATGGIMQSEVGGGFKTNGPRAIVGEGRRNFPEYVIPTDPRFRNNALDLLYAAANDLHGRGRGSASGMRVGASGAPFALGGIPNPIPAIGTGISKAGGAIKGAAEDAVGVIRKGAVIAAFKGPKELALASANKMPNQMHQRDLVKQKIEDVYNWAKGVDAKQHASGGVLGRPMVPSRPSMPSPTQMLSFSSKASAADGSGSTLVAGHSSSVTYNFYGDLSFPNIKSGSDAEEFVKNLESLAG